MAKSIRAKTKRAFRRVKRESGVFAAADAARLHRLSAKLRAKLGTDQEGDVIIPAAIEDAVEQTETTGGWYWFAMFGLVDPDALRAD